MKFNCITDAKDLFPVHLKVRFSRLLAWELVTTVTYQSRAHSFAQFFNHSATLAGLWVNIGHRNKTAFSQLNPVLRSRSKSTSCPRKGSLLKFQSNSTATSQMECYVWKPCTCIDWTIFNFGFDYVLSNLQLKIIIYCVINLSLQKLVAFIQAWRHGLKLNLVSVWGVRG